MPSIEHWIYPTNKTVRDYQFNIVQKALFTNTLVALPTGLGKTFIAAVIIYNYFEWFPNSKIIFMAPTKPLVAQQINACYEITGIFPNLMEELTGSKSPVQRRSSWISKRLFFLTPQILDNDLSTGICPADEICLLVVDEAHKATGNHSYCQVIKYLLAKNHHQFRVLALSATPGSDIKVVQQVVENLLISHIDSRTEDSFDLQPYRYKKKTDLIVVKLTEEMVSIRNSILDVISIFTDPLRNQKIISVSDESLHPFTLVEARTRFRTNRNNPTSLTHLIEGCFAIAHTLVQALSLLSSHGIRSFYSKLLEFKNDSSTKSKAKQDCLSSHKFNLLMDRLNQITNQPNFSSHPKLGHLISNVLKHFSDESDTRVMVFSQYRESVEEIVVLLNENQPTIRATSFIGQSSSKQGKGFTQKDQQSVINKFQKGDFNVIVATCIGEEGLDIGEVDLIVCFDTQASPVRMLQRIGRTGRKRDGHIIVLLTQGKEEEQYKKSQNQYKNVQKGILDAKKLTFYKGPTFDIIPPGSKKPICIKREIEVVPNEFENQRILKSKSEKKKPLESSKPKVPKKPKTTKANKITSIIEEPPESIKKIPKKRIPILDLLSDNDFALNSDDLLEVDMFSKKMKPTNESNQSSVKKLKSKVIEPYKTPSKQMYNDSIHILLSDDFEPITNTIQNVNNIVNNERNNSTIDMFKDEEFDQLFGELPDELFDDDVFNENTTNETHDNNPIISKIKSTSPLLNDVFNENTTNEKHDNSPIISKIKSTIPILNHHSIHENNITINQIQSIDDKPKLESFSWPEQDGVFIFNQIIPEIEKNKLEKYWESLSKPISPIQNKSLTSKNAIKTDSFYSNTITQNNETIKIINAIDDNSLKSSQVPNEDSIKIDSDEFEFMNDSFLECLDKVECDYYQQKNLNQDKKHDTVVINNPDDEFIDQDLFVSSPFVKPTIMNKSAPIGFNNYNNLPDSSPLIFNIRTKSLQCTPLNQNHNTSLSSIKSNQHITTSTPGSNINKKSKSRMIIQETPDSGHKKRKIIGSNTTHSNNNNNKVPKSHRTINQFYDIEAGLSDNGKDVSSDEIDSNDDQDLPGFVIGDKTPDQSFSFYQRGLLTQNVMGFGDKVKPGAYKLKYKNNESVSSPYYLSEEQSEAGSLLDFVVNDSQVEPTQIESSDLF